MKKLYFKKIKGYIEGFYGKLYSWDDRINILDTMSQNKMNFYFYCPKEDLKHRQEWRDQYSKEWLKNFQEFNLYANKKNIKVIFGVSPGLDFNFKSFLDGDKKDLNFLLSKFNNLMAHGATNFCILFDDIPYNSNLPNKLEGVAHAKLINTINLNFNIPIFNVPRIYSDELNYENPQYIKFYFNNIFEKSNTFYCGKNIVSKSFNTRIKIIKNQLNQDKLIFWDNFYANDYCPKRLIIGPWQNTSLIKKSMINGTGLLETDKLIIQIVNNTGDCKNKFLEWKKVLKKNNVPDNFFYVHKFFLSPNFSYETKLKNLKTDKNIFNNLDFLLWKWKTNLSREWYPYLLNLKHDLQIVTDQLSWNRILKTQTNPFQKILLNRRKLDD